MITEIGNIIIDKIKTLPWIDKYSGVVKPISYKSKTGENKYETKIFPGSCQMNFDNCSEGQYKSLTPDSSKKSVLYLEDKGIRFIARDKGKVQWKANYDLIVWLNMPALGFTDCSYSSVAIQGIVAKIPFTPFQSGIYQQLTINVVGQQPKSSNPFSKYSYDETVNQFLIYPFDYFVLSIDVDFLVDKRCLEIEPLGIVDPCFKPKPQKSVKIRNKMTGEIIYEARYGEFYDVIVASGIDEGEGPDMIYEIQVVDIN